MLVLNLDREPYGRAWTLQHRLVAARQEERIGDVLLLMEHDPVVTVGRAGDASHILGSSDKLREAGISVHRVERGGDVTYHGPGQLVGYPILSLHAHHLGASDYMHALEDVLVRTLLDFRVPAHQRADLIGVWVGTDRKIASLGARIERGVTYHGFALNVAPDLEHFCLIVPCGLAGIEITSIERELGKPIDMRVVRERVIEHFGEVFDLTLEETTLAELTL